MSNEQMYCLRWNNHLHNFLAIFEELYKTESLVDVTLATSDGPPIKCHRMVLAACSPYFHEMFLKNPQDLTVCLIHGIRNSEIRAILDFVYTGSCNVKGEMIPRLIDAARDLKIKGLTEDTPLHSTKIEPDYAPTSPSVHRHSLPSVNNSSHLTNGHITSPVNSSSFHIPLYGQSPMEQYINTQALNNAFPGFAPLLQNGLSGLQRPPSKGHSSSYDTSIDSSPLSRKKQLANREMPILRDVLASRREEEAEKQERYSIGQASPHGSDHRRSSAEFSDSKMKVENNTVNGVPASRGPRAERGRAASGKNGPEWKRYKQYTREDIQSAMSAVGEKQMSALQAARQYGVPSRTLYDKLKKAGILPSRSGNSKCVAAMPSSSRGSNKGSARFPYPGELNGAVYGNGGDHHSEGGESDSNNEPLSDSVYSAMMLQAVEANRRAAGPSTSSAHEMVVDMSTHSCSSPSQRSSPMDDQVDDHVDDHVEDLSVSRVAADVAVISRAMNAVLQAARDAAAVDEKIEKPAV